MTWIEGVNGVVHILIFVVTVAASVGVVTTAMSATMSTPVGVVTAAMTTAMATPVGVVTATMTTSVGVVTTAMSVVAAMAAVPMTMGIAPNRGHQAMVGERPRMGAIEMNGGR